MTEVVIVDGVRTPIGKMGGALSSVRPDDLLAETYKALIERTGIDPALISTRAEVKDLLRNGAGEESEIENNRLATGWRWQLIGEDLLSRFGKD